MRLVHTISNAQAKFNTVAEMCFIPSAEKAMTCKELQNIVRNKWDLTSANMLINCDAGSVHPRVLATEKLSDQPQFEGRVNQSKAQLRKTGNDEDLKAMEDPSTMQKATNGVINLLIFQRLMTVFSAILDAPRSRAIGSSSTEARRRGVESTCWRSRCSRRARGPWLLSSIA